MWCAPIRCGVSRSSASHGRRWPQRRLAMEPTLAVAGHRACKPCWWGLCACSLAVSSAARRKRGRPGFLLELAPTPRGGRSGETRGTASGASGRRPHWWSQLVRRRKAITFQPNLECTTIRCWVRRDPRPLRGFEVAHRHAMQSLRSARVNLGISSRLVQLITCDNAMPPRTCSPVKHTVTALQL